MCIFTNVYEWSWGLWSVKLPRLLHPKYVDINKKKKEGRKEREKEKHKYWSNQRKKWEGKEEAI
jgi:hypothetical protein